jgi:hypothetical protein
MTTSMLKTETNNNGFSTETIYSFNVLTTETKMPMGEYQIIVDEYNGDVAVNYIIDDYISKTKFFTDSLDAHYYAMCLVRKFKAKYN